MKSFTYAVVIWEDATVESGDWTEEDDMPPGVNISCGFLIRRNKDKWILAQTICLGEKPIYGERLRIPKVNILGFEIWKLKRSEVLRLCAAKEV